MQVADIYGRIACFSSFCQQFGRNLNIATDPTTAVPGFTAALCLDRKSHLELVPAQFDNFGI